MKRILIITALLATTNLLWSQIKFSDKDFNFYSDFDREMIHAFFLDSTESKSYLGVFLTSDCNSNSDLYLIAKLSIEAVVNDIKKTKEYKKGGSKLVKHTYKLVHERFFDKYRAESLFSEIFTKKEYNCATASALFSIIFKELNIPFDINYSENHVFLIVYPKTFSIVVEATNPISGTLSYSKVFIDNYVSFLRKSKLISQLEMESKSTNELFKEYFFKTKVGNQDAMAGILFYNQGVFLMEKKDYEKALQMSIRSSYYLNDFEKSNFLVLGAAGMFLQNGNINSPEYYKVLGLLTQFNSEFISKNDITNTVANNFRNFALMGEEELLKKSFNSFISSISDSSLLSSTSSTYYKEMGRLNYLRQEFLLSFNYLDTALLLNSQDKETELFLIDLLPRVIDVDKDIEASVRKLNTLFVKHSKLAQNSLAQMVRSNLYLFVILNCFEKGDHKKGETYFASLIVEYPFEQTKFLNQDLFEKVVGEVSIFYYRRSQLKKSNEKVDVGLKYFPNSNYLKRIKGSLNN